MISRRTFFRRCKQLLGGSAALAVGSGAYGVWEASSVRVDRRTIAVPNLPSAFEGKTVAVLADLHHGPQVSLDFIRRVVRMANELQPDLFALVGDYGHRGQQAEVQTRPCLEALSGLEAPLGAFAVPGNHDMLDRGRIYRETIVETSLTDLTNRNIALTLRGQQLWLAGVDDPWWGRPNLRQALTGVPRNAAVLLLCHNPDFMEQYPDRRVSLALCGHTHGGQVYLPVLGAPWIPSKYGMKYRHGLVQGPASLVFVSRGIGESGVPLRMNAPPEVNLLTLVAA